MEEQSVLRRLSLLMRSFKRNTLQKLGIIMFLSLVMAITGMKTTSRFRLCTKIIPLVRAMGYGEITLNNMYMWGREDQRLSNMLEDNVKRTRFVSMRLDLKMMYLMP